MTSDDGGKTFTAPRLVDGGTPIGRADVTILEDGSALVLWVDSTPEAAEIRVRRYAPLGNPSPPITIASIANSRSTGFPRIEADGNAALVAWTGNDRRVHTAIVELK